MVEVLIFRLVWLFRQRGISILLYICVSIIIFSQCCICKVRMVPPTVTIRAEDRQEMFLRRHIIIPTGSRCCESHLVNGHLMPSVFLTIQPYMLENRPFSSEQLLAIFQSYRAKISINKHLDFDGGAWMTDADYVNMTGFTYAQHSHILSFIPAVALKNTSTRSNRVALGCLLMKLKLGLSNSVLASLVGIRDKRQMSRIIASARMALAKHFVPHYLGLAHLTREEVLSHHTSPIASGLLSEGGKHCILVLDGTYLYIYR
jgi:hypothetical protein